VYVFVRPGGSWSTENQTAKLTPSGGQANDRFGGALAIASDGSTLVAGARRATVNANVTQGKVYVFVQPVGGWTGTSQHETAMLTAQDGNQQDGLGRSVAVSSDASTIVAGAYFATVGSSNAAQGKVYVFRRPGAAWITGTAQAELTAADGAAGDQLGFSVGASSDATAIVAGANFAAVGANSGQGGQGAQGAAYVFAEGGSNPGLPPPAGFPVSKPGGGGGGGGGAAPAVGSASVSPSSFPAAPSGPSATASRLRKFGTKVTYTLSQAASVRFTVQQPQLGRKVRHGRKTTCDRPTAKNAKRKRCTRIVTLSGSFTLTGVAGTNKFHFTGRLNGKRLAPGKYMLVATPQANGKTGRAVATSFKIIR
jgi:hypothetical protein